MERMNASAKRDAALRRAGTCCKGALLASALILSGGLLACSNDSSFMDSIVTEVMAANNRFLKVSAVTIPWVDEDDTQIDPTATLSIKFDRDIDLATVTPETLQIVYDDGSREDYPAEGVSWNAATKTLSLRVYPYLRVNEEISMLIAGIKGSDGSRLQESVEQSFRTRGVLAGSILGIAASSGASETGYTNSPEVAIRFAVNDFFPYFKYQLSCDGLNWNTLSEYISRGTGEHLFDADLSTVPGWDASTEGALSVHIRFFGNGTDSGAATAGLSDEAPLVFDKTAPQAGTLTLSGDDYTSSPAIGFELAGAVDGSDSAADSGLSVLRLSNDGSAWSDPLAMQTAGSWHLETGAGGSAARGPRTVQLAVRDRAGNWSDTVSAAIVWDDEKPTLAGIAINGGDAWATSPAVSVTASSAPTDAYSPVDGIRLSNDGTNWEEWRSYAATNSWNLESGAGGTASEGARTVYAQVRDRAGNVSLAAQGTISLDTTAPTPGSWQFSGGKIYFNTTAIFVEQTAAPADTTSGIASLRLSNDGSSWSTWQSPANSYAWDFASAYGGNSSEGAHTVYLQAKDTAGNLSANVSLPLTYDITPPAAPSAPDLAAADDSGSSTTDNLTRYTSGLSFSGTAESGATVQLYRAGSTLLGSAASNGSWSIDATLAAGSHSITARARDTAGNESVVSTALGINIDTTTPAEVTVSATTPTADRTPTWTWTAGEAGSSYQYYWAGAWTGTQAANFTPSSNLQDGQYSLYVRVVDAAGNTSGNSSKLVQVNAPPATPTVSATTPTLNKTPTWSWTTGGFGNGTFRYQLDGTGGTWLETTATSWTSSLLTDTEHTLYVQERDAGGQWSASGSKLIRVTPCIPYNTQTGVSRTPTLSWRSVPLATGYELYLSLNGTTWSTAIAVSNANYKIPTAAPASATIYWKVKSFSRAGTAWHPSTGSYTFTTSTK